MESIKLVLFLAWRNVIRYRKRTVQSFLILFCGAFCVILVDAYLKGYSSSSTERVVRESGHLDVHAKGYLDSAGAMPLDLTIADADALMETMLASAGSALSPGVQAVLSPSIETGCMLSNGEVARAASVYVTDPFAKTLSGKKALINPRLSALPDSIVSGHFFSGASEKGALLDEKYARKLGLASGDSLILLGNDSYGSFSLLETKIIGIVRESSLPGEAGCLVDRAGFAPAFGLENGATAISLWFISDDGEVMSGSGAERPASAAVMKALSGEDGLVVRPFAEISASYTAMFDFLDVFLAGMMAVFALVAGVGMCNAILLSVQDRLRDIGTLRAIALSSRQAGLMIYAETFIIGLFSALSALVFGLVTVYLLETSGSGIRFEMADMAPGLPDFIRPVLYPLRIAVVSLISAVFPVLAAVIPAHAAKNLTIRECFSS